MSLTPFWGLIGCAPKAKTQEMEVPQEQMTATEFLNSFQEALTDVDFDPKNLFTMAQPDSLNAGDNYDSRAESLFGYAQVRADMAYGSYVDDNSAHPTASLIDVINATQCVLLTESEMPVLAAPNYFDYSIRLFKDTITSDEIGEGSCVIDTHPYHQHIDFGAGFRNDTSEHFFISGEYIGASDDNSVSVSTSDYHPYEAGTAGIAYFDDSDYFIQEPAEFVRNAAMATVNSLNIFQDSEYGYTYISPLSFSCLFEQRTFWLICNDE